MIRDFTGRRPLSVREHVDDGRGNQFFFRCNFTKNGLAKFLIIYFITKGHPGIPRSKPHSPWPAGVGGSWNLKHHGIFPSLTWENALSFRSSVGTFSFLLLDLVLWAFLWLSEFLIFNYFYFGYESLLTMFHNLWSPKNNNHSNKTRWWRDGHLECDEQFSMNFTLRSSFFINDSHLSNSVFQLCWYFLTQFRIQKPWLDADSFEDASFESDLLFNLLWDPRTTMAKVWPR